MLCMGNGLVWAGIWGRWGEGGGVMKVGDSVRARAQRMEKVTECRAKEDRLYAMAGHGNEEEPRKSGGLD